MLRLLVQLQVILKYSIITLYEFLVKGGFFLSVIKVIKETFIQFYEYLFKFIVLDLVWFLVISSPFFLAMLLPNPGLQIVLLAITILLFGPSFLSGLHNVRGVINKDDVSIKDFFKGIKTYFKRGLLAFLLMGGIYFLLFIDMYFFVSRTSNIVMQFISIFFFYLVILFSIVQIYFWGLLVIQGDIGIFTILKRSALITLDNALYSFLLFLFLFLLALIITVLGVGLPLLFLGLIGISIIIGTRNVLDKYQETEE